MLKRSTLNSLKLAGLGTMLIIGFLRFWVGLCLIGLSVIVWVEFLLGTTWVMASTSFTRAWAGQISWWYVVENGSLLVPCVGMGLIVSALAYRTFWGFWRGAL